MYKNVSSNNGLHYHAHSLLILNIFLFSSYHMTTEKSVVTGTSGFAGITELLSTFMCLSSRSWNFYSLGSNEFVQNI